MIARGTAGGSKSVAAWNAQGVKLTDAGVANTVTTLVRSRRDVADIVLVVTDVALRAT